MRHTTRSVAILAGGRATRYGGRDKSTLLVDGRTILDRQLAELSSLTDDILIVGVRVPDEARRLRAEGASASADASADRRSPGEGSSASLAEARADHERAEAGRPPSDAPHPATDVVRRIADIVPGCGPLGGLHAALTEARGDAVFLVACDMPYVTAPLVDYLFSLACHADIVVPQTERGYHPLCAVYTRACLAPVAARLGERRLRMRELVGEMRTRVVTAEDIDRFGDRHLLLANVNTPAEYAGLEAFQGHKL
jgi:molybdopterin-guanine dinucleotide biosynthesis protein A